MRFQARAASFYHLPNRVDLFFRDVCDTASTGDYRMHPWRRQDVELPPEPSLEKDIAGKQRQPELLVPVFPTVDSPVERKEDLEPLARKDMRDCFLMLMPGIECMPDMIAVAVGWLD
jgi:hypothetical protein